MKNQMLFVCLLMGGLLGGCQDRTIGQGAGPAQPAYVFNWANIADSATTSLTRNFYNPAGRYFNANSAGDATFHYWPQAHALDVLVDAYLRTNDARYVAAMNDWRAGVRAGNGNTFLNDFYDDMLWNALAMLRAYDATNQQPWLDATLLLWEDIKTGWNDSQGGGIAWRKSQRTYKNTPANAPAIILAARLYQRLKRPADLDWANKIYAWQKRTLVDEATGFVFDGINRTGDGQIDRNWRFTYNQGVWIGAGLELHRITGNPTFLNDATKTATFAITDSGLTTNGLMRDEGGGDGGLFKGVLVRYLTQLALDPAVPGANRSRYATFLRFNAETLWRTGTLRPALLFGTNWSRPPADGRTDLTTQLSGAILLEAAALLHRSNAF